MKKVLNAQQMKSCDKREILEGTASEVLMERAAAAVCCELRGSFDTRKILFVCGGGNNGGDGLIAARYMAADGCECDILFCGDERSCTAETRKQLDCARRTGVVFTDAPDYASYGVIVDAMFGIGLTREITGRHAEIIKDLNRSGRPVVAVDIPSGVCADTGEVKGIAVTADTTVTFAACKYGLLSGEGARRAGRIICADIGIRCDDPGMPFAIEKSDLSLIPARDIHANKGTCGRVLVVGGAPGMCGAVYLSALAAYRCGAGLVEVFTADENRVPLQTLLPEAIVKTTNWSEPDTTVLEAILGRASALVAGPGMGQGAGAVKILRAVSEKAKCVSVYDADALNIAAKGSAVLPRGGNTVITPHPGELSRLCGIETEKIKASLMETAKKAAAERGVICVAKDSRTVTTDGENTFINTSGSPALAKGGSGDVLAGVIAGLSCSGLSPLGAAALGVYVHGLAGELAAQRRGVFGVLAHEVADCAGEVLRGAGR